MCEKKKLHLSHTMTGLVSSAKAESFNIAWWTMQSPTKIKRRGYPMWDRSSIPKVQTEDEPSEVNEVDCGISAVRDCVGEPGQGFLEGCFDSFDRANRFWRMLSLINNTKTLVKMCI
jgi:hypothetical protein